jgi:hypothetical protein
MILHDFPFFVDKIKELKGGNKIKESYNGIEYDFIYSLQISYINVKPLRVVIGLLDHIKVRGSMSVLNEIRKFINDTVVNSLGRSI